jgi:hypothetical protein
MGAGSTTGSIVHNSTPRAKVGLLSTLAIVALIAAPATAFAAKGGGTSAPAWIALATVSGLPVAAAQPQLGSAVRFATGYASTTKNPWVSVTCYQGSTLVFGEGGKPSADFTLGGASSRWLETGGAASCRAELGDLYWRGGKQYYTYMAHTNFEAGG